MVISTKKHDQGFTLIELLIATTLLSLVMMAGVFAYTTYTQKWTQEIRQYSEAKRTLTSIYQLDSIISTIKPYIVKVQDEQVGFLFIGQKDRLLAIRNNSLIDESSSEVFRLAFVENQDKTFALQYQSKSLHNGIILTESDTIEFTQRLTLFDRVESYKITYFGYPSFAQKSNAYQTFHPSWYEEFIGLDRVLMPEKIQLDLVIEGELVTFMAELDKDADRHIADYIETNT